MWCGFWLVLGLACVQVTLQNEIHVSEIPHLRELTPPGFYMGSAASPNHFDDANYTLLLSTQYAVATPENCLKWAPSEPQRGMFDFRKAYQLEAFATEHKMNMRGHVLAWHKQLPTWLCSLYSSDKVCLQSSLHAYQLKIALYEHVTVLAGNFSRAPFLWWDAVNEAVDDYPPYGMRDTVWSRAFGEEYVSWTFQWAHTAAPNTLLFYNDYGIHGLGGKSDAVYDLLKNLLANGVPVGGVGMQMHVSLGERPTWVTTQRGHPAFAKVVPYEGVENFTANVQRLVDLGLMVHITEIDVRIYNGNGSESERLQAQADVYGELLSACLLLRPVQTNAPGCQAFVSWGFTDKYTWITPPWYPADAPLPFDTEFNPKLAFYAMANVLDKM